MNKYTVFGNPIEQSKSPQIHQAFAAQFDMQLDYDKRLAEIGEFKAAVDRLRSQGGKGANVTAPFKGDAFDMADNLTELAKLSEAVNTLTLNDDGTINGDTTDGPGLVLDLTIHKAPIKGARILLIGAGGAARGVLKPLLDCQPQQVVVCNRTHSRAQALAEKFSQFGNVVALQADELETQGYDLVINSSSSSLTFELPPVPATIFNSQTFAYDMSYKNQDTTFVTWAKDNNVATAIDGLGMLIGQAAESFYIWHGKKPDVRKVLTEMRDQLTQ
ncbi:shikimate dehydrogenase [Saccharobesus litoralis]|uniref:Shikimate dehydrogenase (NADP(+)) n=1 Tax=Saccharobesus litoralis TaxID=2172099 RepID=A0A2S0VQ85_9ALTE|nr:shikimate dehydrogenase [Saccharobesus litoralis]AWB66359.1 shikimate dehydrogenase [Saccharobesus litoralis]